MTFLTRHDPRSEKGEDWSEAAKLYNQLTIGINQRPISIMLEKCNSLLPLSQTQGIHDNGCGPGPIITRIIEDFGPEIPKTASLSASDFSEPMIEQVRKFKETKVQEAGTGAELWQRLELDVLDAMDLKTIPDQSRSHVTAGWVYFMTVCMQHTHIYLPKS